MTINELYRSFLKELSRTYNNHEASNITSMIFEHYAGIDRASLIRDPNVEAGEQLTALINASLAELKKNKPVQYITGEAWFYHMKLKVSPAVLIPRPETEELVATLIETIKDKPSIKLLDVGTGSGCVAIAIKKNKPGCRVTAIDISADALAIAGENAIAQHTDILFLQTDFLSKSNREELEKFDVIVSNPPYIPKHELGKMDKNVTAYEPHLALFVDDKQPLIFYECIADFGREHLNVSGMIFLETHEELAEAVCSLFNNNFYRAAIKKDIFEKQRMVIVTRYH